MGILVTYSRTLMQELRNSPDGKLCGQWADEMDRQVADDDVMSESHKSNTQVNRTNASHKQIAQNKMTSHPRMEKMNDAFGCFRTTQVHTEYLRLVNLTEICPS